MKEFAKVVWCPEDIKDIRPRWSLKRCEEWLKKEEGHIKEIGRAHV